MVRSPIVRPRGTIIWGTEMETRKVVVEVSIPGTTRIEQREVEETVRKAARRTVLYLILEKVQKKEPTQEEIERLAREAKQVIYKRVSEEP